MGSFSLSYQDVLFISISVNTCVLLQVISTRLARWAVPYLGHRTSMGRTLLGLHQRWPGLLGRILMEQASLFTLLVLILVNLSFVSSAILPFREHSSDEYHQLTRVILCAATARFLVNAMGFLLVNDVTSSGGTDTADNDEAATKSRIGILGSETGNASWHFVYCLLNIVSNVMGLGYKQNLLLIGTSSFMELNSTSLVICRLIKLADRHRGCRSYLKTSVLSCAVCLFSRVLLPVLFLFLALSQGSPFLMDSAPLTWFFVSGISHCVLHSVLLVNSFKRVHKALAFSSEVAGHSCRSSNGPFSIYNYPDRLTNDIFEDAGTLENEKKGGGGGGGVGEGGGGISDEDYDPRLTSAKLRDFNYGYLPCYDNRNLCSLVSNLEEEKLNFLQKKNSSKHEFIHALSPKEGGFMNLNNHCSSPSSSSFNNNNNCHSRSIDSNPACSGDTKEFVVRSDQNCMDGDSLNDVIQNDAPLLGNHNSNNGNNKTSRSNSHHHHHHHHHPHHHHSPNNDNNNNNNNNNNSNNNIINFPSSCSSELGENRSEGNVVVGCSSHYNNVNKETKLLNSESAYVSSWNEFERLLDEGNGKLGIQSEQPDAICLCVPSTFADTDTDTDADIRGPNPMSPYGGGGENPSGTNVKLLNLLVEPSRTADNDLASRDFSPSSSSSSSSSTTVSFKEYNSSVSPASETKHTTCNIDMPDVLSRADTGSRSAECFGGDESGE